MKKCADQLGPREWWLPKLAEAISVSAGKLADWQRRGWLRSRRTPAQHLWILLADKQEMERLRKLVSLSHRGVVEYPAEFTTPRRTLQAWRYAAGNPGRLLNHLPFTRIDMCGVAGDRRPSDTPRVL
jgi:hypothetical protein